MYKLWGFFVVFLTRDQIFSSVEKPTVERLTLSHAIYPSTPFGPVWTLTYLNVFLDKVLVFIHAFGISRVAAFKLVFPSVFIISFKWSGQAVWPLSTCQEEVCNVFLRINIEIVSQDTNNQLNLIMLFYKCGSVILLTWWVSSCSNQSDQSKIYKYK